jgi:hypothetical protein
MRVKTIMRAAATAELAAGAPTPALTTDASVGDAARLVLRHRAPAVAVVEGDSVVGMVTRDDLLGEVVRTLEAGGPARLSRILMCPPEDTPAPVVQVARALAARDGATLIALHVLPGSLSFVDTALAACVVQDVLRVRRDEARAWLQSLAEEARVEVTDGPFDAIVLQVARRLSVDLIVIAAEDAERVLDRAPCPVLAVPVGDRP